MIRSEKEIKAKLLQVCAVDATIERLECRSEVAIGVKVGAAQTLLWVLGENELNWHISSKPGLPKKK